MSLKNENVTLQEFEELIVVGNQDILQIITASRKDQSMRALMAVILRGLNTSTDAFKKVASIFFNTNKKYTGYGPWATSVSKFFMDSDAKTTFRGLDENLTLGEIKKKFEEKEIAKVKMTDMQSQVLMDNLHLFLSLDNLTTIEIEDDSQETAEKLDYPFQRLLFGAPGTGKSYKLEKEWEEATHSTDNLRRLVFYPSYSYAQFMGTYRPSTQNEKVCYGFHLGPMGEILSEALNNPSENYLLIIEELNRANASAVFGDLFQLLDRKDSGESHYDITISDDIQKKMKLKNEDNRLNFPSNLYIWATMNPADQNVYTLDSSFKRRWTSEYLPIDANMEEMNKSVVKDKNNEQINWNAYRKTVNSILSESDAVPEDKLIGPFFISESECGDFHTFKSKVLMYLLTDVIKYIPSLKNELFVEGITLNKISSSDNFRDIITAPLLAKAMING